MNHVMLVGRLGKDPVLSATQSGKQVCKFSLATAGISKDDTEWHNIVVWEKAAENCMKFLKKGDQCAITGRLTHRKYTDKEGIERYHTEVVAVPYGVEFLTQKKESQTPVASRAEPAPGVSAESDWDVPF